MTENYQSYVGVDNVYYALVTQDNVAGYVAGTPAYLAPAMKISKNIKLSETLQWADNAVFDRLSGEGETTISCEVTGLSPQLAAILFGMTYDVATARVFDNGATPPDIALGFRGERSDGKYRYFWFLKGSFRKPKEDISTKSDKPELKSITVEFAAVKTTHPFELVDSGLTDGVKRVFGDTNDASFSAATWFNAVQVPSVGAPAALTCTPLPADAATNQLATVCPTLTFNNALTTGVAGVLLTKVDGVIVSAAITINAANKVITITPAGNLTAAAQYLITLAGVRDIYGQAFASTVYDFTVAA